MVNRINVKGLIAAGCLALGVSGGIWCLAAAADDGAGKAPGVAATGVAAAEPAKSDTAKSAKPARKPQRGRLPNNFGRIGLSDEQREKIYTIQAEYRDEIRELQQKLDELRSKQREQIEAVLTAEQKKQLAELSQKPAAAESGASGESKK